MRQSMSRCPAEYCSMTSFTSYGRNVSLNFFFATWNFMILHAHMNQKKRERWSWKLNKSNQVLKEGV